MHFRQRLGKRQPHDFDLFVVIEPLRARLKPTRKVNPDAFL